METDTEQSPPNWLGKLRFAEGTQWYHRIALIFVVACVAAGALAASWPRDEDLPFEPLIVLMMPCVTILIYAMIGLVLRCIGTGHKRRELSFLGNAYLCTAVGYGATLPLWPSQVAAVGAWLSPLGQIGFALGVAMYCLDEEHSGISLRYLKYGTLALTALVLAGAVLNQLFWPLRLLEVVAVAGALLLLLGHPQKWPALEAWLTAGVSLLLIERVLLQISIQSKTLVWLTGWMAQLVTAIILLYVVLAMAQRPQHR